MAGNQRTGLCFLDARQEEEEDTRDKRVTRMEVGCAHRPGRARHPETAPLLLAGSSAGPAAGRYL